MSVGVRVFVAVVAFAGGVACQSSPPLGPSLVVNAHDAAAQSPGGGPINGEGDPPSTLVSDAGAEREPPTAVTPAMPAAQVDCDALAASGTPDELGSLFWERQVRQGQGSDAEDFVTIDKGCVLKYQHENVQQQSGLSSTDCAAARGWATSPTFVDAVRTGAGCVDGDGNPTEMFEIYFVTGGKDTGRKFWNCHAPGLEALRACLQPLVDRVFPR